MEKEPKQTSKNSTSNSKWDILAKYAQDERHRVNRLKKDMADGEISDNNQSQLFGNDIQSRYERNKIDTPPSPLRKLGRTALDLLNITIPNSEIRRDREAMSIAVAERKTEKAEEEAERMMDDTVDEIRRNVNTFLYEAAREKRDHENLKHDLIETMDLARREQHEYAKNERTQELIERDLNKRLLTIDNLEEEVLAENPEVVKRSIEFEDTQIPVYDLKGLPFSMLSHAIDYRYSPLPNRNHIGSQTYRDLLENPSLWTETREQAKQTNGYGTRDNNARGNVIATSYINSESNLNSRMGSSRNDYTSHIYTCYGFSHLDGGSLLKASQGDGATPNTINDRSRTSITPYQIDILSDLEGSNTQASYNEFLLRRYSETGQPKLPDYIIAQNGFISESMLRHAKFFRIPIVNIDEQSYQTKFEQRALTALENISPDSSYTEISSAIDQIKATARYNKSIHTFDSIGVGNASKYFNERRYQIQKAGTAIDQKLLDLQILELAKRPQFIIDEIEKATKACEQATAAGQEYQFSSDMLSSLNVRHFGKSPHADGSYSFGFTQDYRRAFNSVEITMIIKGSTRFINTEIYDGGHPFDTERYKAIHGEDSLDDANSNIYNKIMPVITSYFNALQANLNLKLPNHP